MYIDTPGASYICWISYLMFYYLQLPLDVKVPSNWVKINSTKKTVRYHPPDVLTALDHLALASEQLTVVCRAAWDSFLSGFGKYYAEFQAAVQALASLDCLHSLAVLSRNKVSTEGLIRISCFNT